ncbi:MAG: dienelactone hydrolase family protein [Paludibacter sp.]
MTNNERNLRNKRKHTTTLSSVIKLFLYVLFVSISVEFSTAQVSLSETLSPLKNGVPPQTFDELWKEFDPRKEPLEIEVLKQWEEDGVVMRVVRYRIGIFKGQKAIMAGVYGFPKGGSKLPGLVQIHGGGQSADYRSVFTNAKRGYATISIAWAGRINAPGYNVTPEIVKLFWDNKTENKDYKLTTDWGALDAYHAPCRNPKNEFAKVVPALWTLDSVESPRNNSWFLCAMGARRALTYLELQPEVDADKLGVYGHSMGGKLTVMTAIDKRVKAAAPSCGGISDRYTDNKLYSKTLSDDVYLKQISCPMMFLMPSNDFHGRMNDLQKAIGEMKSEQWRLSCSPHHNHQDTPEYMVTGLLWFDQYLKGSFQFPDTPKSTLELKSKNEVPVFTVTPDARKPILSVDIYYTQQGQAEGEKDISDNTKNRFWYHAKSSKQGNSWIGKLPIISSEKPLWVYANVVYALEKPVTGAGYYYSIYNAKTFTLSSQMLVVTSKQLNEAGVKATIKSSLLIETFKEDWEKEWFTYTPDDWARKTHKLYDEQWKTPVNSKLVFDVQSYEPNTLVVGIDGYATEIKLEGSTSWQQIVLLPKDFQNAEGNSLPAWDNMKEFRYGASETLISKEQKKTFGGKWNGLKPELRNLRWTN